MAGGLSDDELMEKIKQGDQRAFGELFDRHSPSVLGYCLRTLGGNRAMADDIVQEVWLKVVNNAARYEARGYFKAWLMTITRNATIGQIRVQLPLSNSDEPEQELEGVSDADAERDLLKQADTRKVHNAIECLPESQRVVLMLSVVDGLSHDEIAEKLKITFSAVGSLLFRARKELRTKLKRGEK